MLGFDATRPGNNCVGRTAAPFCAQCAALVRREGRSAHVASPAATSAAAARAPRAAADSGRGQGEAGRWAARELGGPSCDSGEGEGFREADVSV